MLDPNDSPCLILKEFPSLSTIQEGQSYFVQELCNEFPEVFHAELGCLRGFIHHIRLFPGAIPICSRVCSVPLTVKEDMLAELNKLKREGIIEEFESTE